MRHECFLYVEDWQNFFVKNNFIYVCNVIFHLECFSEIQLYYNINEHFCMCCRFQDKDKVAHGATYIMHIYIYFQRPTIPPHLRKFLHCGYATHWNTYTHTCTQTHTYTSANITFSQLYRNILSMEWLWEYYFVWLYKQNQLKYYGNSGLSPFCLLVLAWNIFRQWLNLV